LSSAARDAAIFAPSSETFLPLMMEGWSSPSFVLYFAPSSREGRKGAGGFCGALSFWQSSSSLFTPFFWGGEGGGKEGVAFYDRFRSSPYPFDALQSESRARGGRRGTRRNRCSLPSAGPPRPRGQGQGEVSRRSRQSQRYHLAPPLKHKTRRTTQPPPRGSRDPRRVSLAAPPPPGTRRWGRSPGRGRGRRPVESRVGEVRMALAKRKWTTTTTIAV
jgi:hypothetical protein